MIMLPSVQEQLAAAQGKVVRLRDANVILVEQVMEVEHDRDAIVADSSTTAVRAGQFWDHHATLLEACVGAIDMLSLAGVSIESASRMSQGGSEKWFITRFVMEPRWHWRPLHSRAARTFTT